MYYLILVTFAFFSLIQGIGNQTENATTSKTGTTRLEISELLLTKNRVGNKKAGILCLPDGVVSQNDIDFVGQAQKVINDKIVEEADFSSNVDLVVIQDVNVSLCAKTYLPFGIGATNGYSGSIATLIELRDTNKVHKCKTYEVKFKKPDAMPKLWGAAFSKALDDCLSNGL